MTSFRRTLIAGLVTALVISVPCVAWYVTGSRATRQEVERLLREPRTEARREAERLALQLQRRLESMRLTESKRSPFDYQNLGQVYQDDCIYDLRVESPLAEGPADPLIWTHFQLDEVGQLTIPTGADDGLARGATPSQGQTSIFEELECATSFRLAALGEDGHDFLEERMIQTVDGPIAVGPFEWFTLSVKDQASLVALRTVKTTSAVLTQGFVVLGESLRENLAGSPYAVTIEPGEPTLVGEGLVLLNNQRWTVRVDLDDQLAAANVHAGKIAARFRLTFLIGTFGVSLAGLFLVGLVWQADRLAHRQAQFAASAAHELRTPLAGLQLYGEMLAESIGNPDHRRKYARRISEEAERLGRVVGNVLGYSRLERGGLSVRPQRGDLVETVRDSVTRLSPSLEAKGARLDFHVDDPVGRALFDRDSVHQILLNLVDNAEKYSRDADDRTIEVRIDSKTGRPALSVIDHGRGIDPSVRAKLFERFARTSDRDAPAGLGIGLALVQALAREQNARVSVCESPGGGSCFSVSFQPA